MICGCRPRWLTTLSEPIGAEQAVTRPCPCCGAEAGRRCMGGTAGWLPDRPGRDRAAWVDVCPARLEAQQTMELAA